MSVYQTAHLKENTTSLSKNKKEESGQPLAKKKEEKKIRARGTKQSLSSFCWSCKHRADTVPAAPAWTASNKHDRPSLTKAYRNQALQPRESRIPALKKEVEHRQDFQTTLIISSQKPDRTAHPQRSPLSSTTFDSDAFSFKCGSRDHTRVKSAYKYLFSAGLLP